MPRDTFPPDWDAGEIAERNRRASAYLDRQYDRHVMLTRRQVHMFCTAVCAIGAASMVAARWW